MIGSEELERKKKLCNSPNLSSKLFIFISHIYPCTNYLTSPRLSILSIKRGLYSAFLSMSGFSNDLHADAGKRSPVPQAFEGMVLALFWLYPSPQGEETLGPKRHAHHETISVISRAIEYALGNPESGVPCPNRSKPASKSAKTYSLGLTS